MDHLRFQHLRDQALDSLVKGGSTAAEYQQVLQQIDAAESAARAADAEVEARYRRRGNPDDGLASVPTMIRPAEPPPPLQPVKDMLIDKYRLESSQRGGMGVVWKAWDTKGERWVALKFLPPELNGNEDEIARLRATFKLVEQLDHPHVCRVFDLNEHAQFGWYQVMRWIEGRTLSQYRREIVGHDESLPLEDVVKLLTPVAAALDDAHGRKVLHRDIKPQNVMIDERGQVWVIDFGFAAEVRGSMSRVSQKAAVVTGTRPYIAPEIWDGEPPSKQTDQYALAITAYELLAGRWPFFNDDVAIFARLVLTKAVPAIEGLPAHANAALSHALAKVGKERFANCTEFLAALHGEETPSRDREGAVVRPAQSSLPHGRGSDESPAPSMLAPAKLFDNDLLGELHEFDSDTRKRHARARELEALGHYESAIELLKPILAHARDNSLLSRLEVKRDRVVVLQERVAQAVRDKKHQWLRPEVEELLALVPGDQQLAKLRDGLPQFPGLITLSNGTRLKLVVPGEFTMGESNGKDNPAHRVRITRPFWLGVTAITQAEWKAVMGSNPSHNKASDQHPVENISWEETQVFITKLMQKDAALIAKQLGDISGLRPALRLPSEAEREYATRAGTTTTWYCGNAESELDLVAWYSANSGKATHAVGTKGPNLWGFYDLAGNVWEWCHDWYDADFYKRAAGKVCDDPVNLTSASDRVHRGGGYAYDASYLASASRGIISPDPRSSSLGFRLALGHELK